MDSLTDKIALVTGASQGLGRAIALALAQDGCIVGVNCAHHAEKAERVVSEIESSGGRAFAAVCDISDECAVDAMFRRMDSEFGTLDILVNNARLDPWLRTETMTDGEWFDRVLSVNLRGAYLCSQAFYSRAKKRNWGRIVNISSVRAFRPAEENMIAYSASKAGMHALTRAYAENGAKFGITANTVAPGVVVTENLMKRISPEKYQEELAAVPLGRGSTCEEIASAVLFVLKNASVTGETLNINGGMYYAS